MSSSSYRTGQGRRDDEQRRMDEAYLSRGELRMEAVQLMNIDA